MAVSVPRRLFTVDEYYEMARVGILKPDERVELLDGEIVRMNPIGSPHAWCVKRLNRIFSPFRSTSSSSAFRTRYDWTTSPSRSRMWFCFDSMRPRIAIPARERRCLVIEVADSSIRVDRGRKRRMYARAGIAEYWIVDLNADQIEVYRDPMRSRYRSTTLLGRGDTVTPLFAPDIVVDVNSVLGQVRAEQ